MDEEWNRKGATLSDKTARKEFALTQDEIVAAIDAGRLTELASCTAIPGFGSCGARSRSW